MASPLGLKVLYQTEQQSEYERSASVLLQGLSSQIISA
jgi:hypothetical protein